MSPADDCPTVYTPKEVAIILKISPDQVRALIRSGKLAGTSISLGSGRRTTYRITGASLQSFLIPEEILPQERYRVLKPLLKVKSFLRG